MSVDYLNDAINSTDNEFFRQLIADVDYAIDSFKKYQTVIDKYASDDLQPTGKILEVLNEVKTHINYLVRDRQLELLDDAVMEDDSLDNQEPDRAASSDNKHFSIGHIENRRQALQGLSVITTYFKSTEPHSPISYSLEQAMRWANMPLTDLIRELIPDDSARNKFQNLVGIQSNDNAELE